MGDFFFGFLDSEKKKRKEKQRELSDGKREELKLVFFWAIRESDFRIWEV